MNIHNPLYVFASFHLSSLGVACVCRLCICAPCTAFIFGRFGGTIQLVCMHLNWTVSPVYEFIVSLFCVFFVCFFFVVYSISYAIRWTIIIPMTNSAAKHIWNTFTIYRCLQAIFTATITVYGHLKMPKLSFNNGNCVAKWIDRCHHHNHTSFLNFSIIIEYLHDVVEMIWFIFLWNKQLKNWK